MIDKAKTTTRQVIVCVLAVLLVAGLVPVLPETPRAFAGESEAAQLGSAKGDSAANAASIEEEFGNAVVLGEDAEAALLGQLEHIADNAEAQGAGVYGPPAGAIEAVEDKGLVVADEDEAVLEAQSVTVSNPRVVADSSMESGQVATWDCIWFGSYPQTEITSSNAVYSILEVVSWDANGDATVGGRRYRRISKSDATHSYYWSDDGYGSVAYRYFRYEPIKWRVLKVSGSTALVVADRALDDQRYNTKLEDVTWATSSVRSWLNGYGAASNQPGTDYTLRSFLGSAFSSGERSAILETDVVNADNTYYGTAGGASTRDRVFLLSLAEAFSAAHGFASYYPTLDEARRCKVTDFAHAMGAYRYTGWSYDGSYDGNCWWWLRSPGQYSNMAATTDYNGFASLYGSYVYHDCGAVRPALNLNLASVYYQHAGTVSSNGTVNELVPTTAGDGTGTVSGEDASDAAILDLVRPYISGIDVEYVERILSDGTLSNEEKMARLRAFFASWGIADPLEGVRYLSRATGSRIAYQYLLTNENFLAYNWLDWLYNTKRGQDARKYLYAGGLIFNYEWSSYINPLDHINHDLPGVKKYKAVLKEFMGIGKSNSAAGEVLEGSKETAKYMGKLVALNNTVQGEELDLIMDRIDSCASASERERLQSQFAQLLFSNCVTNRGVMFDGEKLSKALGYSAKVISFADATVGDIVAMINLDRDIETYGRYLRFLQHVQSDEALSPELRSAADAIIDEMENGYRNRIMSIFGNALEFGEGMLFTNKSLMRIALEKAGVSEAFSEVFGGALSTLSFGTFVSNIVVDMGDLVKQAAYTQAYAELGASYAYKLKRDGMALAIDISVDAAWEFFEDYTILWKLRYMGEEQYRDMHKMKMYIFASVPTFNYRINAEAVEENLKFLEKCRFDLSGSIEVPGGVMYEQKAVFRCPVDVDIYAPNGTLVATLADGVESDVTNDHGRFVVTYDTWSGEWAKVACLNDDGDYKMVARGNDLGIMSVQIARKGEDAIQSIDNVAVVPGSSVRLGTGLTEENDSFEVDGDGDGEYESVGEVRKDNLATESVQVETVGVNKQEIELPECGSELLRVSVQPSDATNQQVSWMSRDESVAKVVGGKVEAVGPGETTVLCISQDNTDVIAECAVKVYATKPAFKTQSLTLGGTIGVNFYADLSPLTDEEREGCKATFTVNGRTYEDAYDPDFTNAKGYYGFTCPVTSVEMADKIEATLTWGDGESISKRHSVADYMASFEQYASTFDEETRALVRSVADYGHYVQPFLARTRGWEVGKDHAEMAAANVWDGTEAAAVEAASEGYALVCRKPDGCGVQRMTQALVLDSGTDLCVYAVCDEGVSVVAATLADGTALNVGRDVNGRWRVTVPKIAAHELGREWSIAIETSTGAIVTVKTSALAWVRSALTYEEWRDDTTARNAATSIWRYAKAAEAYKASHSAS